MPLTFERPRPVKPRPSKDKQYVLCGVRDCGAVLAWIMEPGPSEGMLQILRRVVWGVEER